MFLKATLSYPLYELIDKYSKQCVRTRFYNGLVIQENMKWHEFICMIVSKATHLHISRLKCRGGVSQVQWTLPLAARSLTFRPRVHCCVASYNALPAHLPSQIERVQMRALRIIAENHG